MELVGLLDSPFVRRVAVSLPTLRVPFEHRPVSVFRGFDAFRALNPVVKAPTLLADDGSALMDSSLILQYVEAVANRGSLLPQVVPAADFPRLVAQSAAAEALAEFRAARYGEGAVTALA